MKPHYIVKRTQIYEKKAGCRSDLCNKFRCISIKDGCGKECVETRYLCSICMNRTLCDKVVIKKYVRKMVEEMAKDNKDMVFEIKEIDGERLLDIHVRHELYQHNLTEVRRKLGEASFVDRIVSRNSLVSEGNALKVKIQELREVMELLGIEYDESVSLNPY